MSTVPDSHSRLQSPRKAHIACPTCGAEQTEIYAFLPRRSGENAMVARCPSGDEFLIGLDGAGRVNPLASSEGVRRNSRSLG